MKTNAFYRYVLGLLTIGALSLITPSAFADEPTKAIAVLDSASGSQVKGTVTFTKVGDGRGRSGGLTPLANGRIFTSSPIAPIQRFGRVI
jgi:hypothetical protein